MASIDFDYGATVVLRQALAQHVERTPVVRSPALEAALGGGTEVFAKLEFLQRTGTFKARGALATLLGLSQRERLTGVTAVSAGNHAIAVAYAARELDVDAKLVMLRKANQARVERCRALGATLEFADNVHDAFDEAERIKRTEGRYFVHPFEGQRIVHGTATLGLEIAEQVGNIDAVVVPIGGGGLCAGVAAAVKWEQPAARVYGVEPAGAASMRRSISAGKPVAIPEVTTIADSLGAPHAMPGTFGLCRRHVDRVALVEDSELRAAMRFLFEEMRVAVEPACAATTAAILGPLRETVTGKRVVVILCGSNIDWKSYAEYTFHDD